MQSRCHESKTPEEDNLSSMFRRTPIRQSDLGECSTFAVEGAELSELGEDVDTVLDSKSKQQKRHDQKADIELIGGAAYSVRIKKDEERTASKDRLSETISFDYEQAEKMRKESLSLRPVQIGEW